MRYREIVSEEEMLDEWSDEYLQGVSQRTSFRSWFGNSKVVDKNGLPMPQFHYTRNNFDLSQIHPLSHFGTTKAAFARWQFPNNFGNSLGRVAKNHINSVKDISPELTTGGREKYAKANGYWKKNSFGDLSDDNLASHQTIPVFLKIENPIKIVDNGDEHTPFEFYFILKRDLGLIPENFSLKHTGSRFDDEKKVLSVVLSVMKENGYDGFVYKNTQEHKGSLSWVILEPSQVRSVFDFKE